MSPRSVHLRLLVGPVRDQPVRDWDDRMLLQLENDAPEDGVRHGTASIQLRQGRGGYARPATQLLARQTTFPEKPAQLFWVNGRRHVRPPLFTGFRSTWCFIGFHDAIVNPRLGQHPRSIWGLRAV